METQENPPHVNQPVREEGEKKRNAFFLLEVGLLEVGFVILGLAILFGTLNYFNILPVSNSLPFLSFLPTQQKTNTNQTKTQVTKKTLTPEELNKIETKIPYAGCPVSFSLCKTAVEISEDTETATLSALGFSNIPKDEKILSAIAGSIKTASQGSLTVITVTDSSERQAVYEFEKDAIEISAKSGSEVANGQVIGKLNSSEMLINKAGSDFNFIFSIKESGSNIKISPSEAKQGLDIVR